jgi:hypothetical protein
MNIYKKDNKIIVEYQAELPRFNPYMDDSEQHLLGTYPAFTGLIVRHRKDGNLYDEHGFAYTIDMDYKDKDDQVSDFAVMWDGNEEDFIAKCKELNFDIHEIEV